MSVDIDSLEPQIYKILSAPGTDLTTISAKRVRRQLLEHDSSLTQEFLRENKKYLDAVIARVFERVSEGQGAASSQGHGQPVGDEKRSRKRKESEEYDDEGRDEDDDATPPPKKAKTAAKSRNELSDAELARQLSDEINGRSRRSSGKARGPTNGSAKRGGRKKKSAATVDTDDSGDDSEPRKKRKTNGGTAKGGFAKEYTLSEPLAALVGTEKLSRPQVVKHLWDYIKEHELQNPSNKREIMCDMNFKAVFNVEKIDMFRMNKVLGEHLYAE